MLYCWLTSPSGAWLTACGAGLRPIGWPTVRLLSTAVCCLLLGASDEVGSAWCGQPLANEQTTVLRNPPTQTVPTHAAALPA